MSENNKLIVKIIYIAAFIGCIALIIIGQKSIGYPGIIKMMTGLVGLLIMLFLYNRKYQ